MLPQGVGLAEKALELYGNMPIHAIRAGRTIAQLGERYRDEVCDHFTLLFVIEGKLHIQEEAQLFEVIVSQSLILWPGRRHWGLAQFSPDLSFYWLDFRLQKIFSKAGELPGVTQLFRVPQHATVSRPDYLEFLFRRYLDDQETERLLPPAASHLAGLMLCEVADQRSASAVNQTAAAVAGRALTYIRSHLHDPLTASAIAEALGYNPVYLNRVFHQTYRHTLTHEIHLARLGYARHLLLHSNMNATEIARACGFLGVKYFGRLFKRYEGITPMNFRRLNAHLRIDSM